MGLLGRLFGSTYETVDVARARELLDGGAVLVDVRTAQEYRAGHAPAARHIPLDAIGTRQRAGERVVAKNGRPGTVA